MEPTIECQDLFVLLGDDDVVVVDCREDGEWEQLRFQVPGAVRMSPQELKEHAEALPDDELIVLCGAALDGSDVRRAYRQLSLRGRNARILRGGLRAWIGGGFPIERVSSPAHAQIEAAFASP